MGQEIPLVVWTGNWSWKPNECWSIVRWWLSFMAISPLLYSMGWKEKGDAINDAEFTGNVLMLLREAMNWAFVPPLGTFCPRPWDKRSHPLGQLISPYYHETNCRYHETIGVGTNSCIHKIFNCIHQYYPLTISRLSTWCMQCMQKPTKKVFLSY